MSFSLPPLDDGVSRHGIMADVSLTLFSRLGVLVKKAVPALAVIVLCMAGALTFSLTLGARALELTREGALIENLSVVFYALVLLVAVPAFLRGHRAAGLIGLLCLVMGLRELDAHKAFTTYGVFKTRLYVSPDVPMAEKLIAGGVIIALLVLLVLAIRASWRELTQPSTSAGVTMLGLGAFGVFLKEVDGLPRQLGRIGIDLDPAVLAVSKAVEETGEMGLPLLLGLALYQLCRSR